MTRGIAAQRGARFAMLMLAVAALCAGCGREEPKPAATQPAAAAAATVRAPRPTAALAPNASCVTTACHATFATAEFIHGPVSSKACDACHAADAGGHVYPLKRPGNETCSFCHNIMDKHDYQHKVVQQQGCTACHDPHLSRTKFLIKADSIEQLCRKCHDVPLKKFAHEPFVAGQCTLCHEPHESDVKGLLRGGSGSEHCLMCHTDMKKRMAETKHVHDPVKKDCLQCHSPHATDFPRELKASTEVTCLSCHDDVKKQIAQAKVKHSAVHDGASCANCHDPHLSDGEHLLKGRMDNVCAACHVKPILTAGGRTIAAVAPSVLGKNLHGPIRAGDCSACHQAHGSENGSLLRKPFPESFYAPFDVQTYALCFTCHEKDLVMQQQTTTLTNFRDGSRNLHYVHVHQSEKGRTCKTCHEIHGSDLPNHMASSVPFEGSTWAMPIRYERRPDGGRCSPGCHQSYTYSRTATTRPAGGGQQ